MPAKQKGAHHRGTYHVASARVRAAAYANPLTRCWRCGRTLPEIRTHKPKAKWTAGHLNDGQVGGPLAAECSPCNYSAGATLRHQAPPPVTSQRW